MAYPLTKLPVKVELQLAGVWTDVTNYVRVPDKVGIIRGRRDEGGSFEPGELNLTLNNQAGRFSPRNPSGPYYGALTRNTPIRVSVVAGTPRLRSPTASDFFQTPDSGALSITGDIDLRADVTLTDWATGVNPIQKFSSAGQFAYILDTLLSGALRIQWSADGTVVQTLASDVPLPRSTGRQSVRATLDVNNGAGGKTATFYYGSSVDGPWTQLGSPVIEGGTTSIFDSTSVVTTLIGTGEVHAIKILDGIGGTERANPDFTAQPEGTTSFADAAGNTWTASGNGVVTARRYRFHGEVSSWPQQWDISERDAWVPIQAAGVLRRLGQGTAPLAGPIQRAVLRSATPAYGYWPMEDAEGSTSIASGLPGGPVMTFTGDPALATSEAFFASAPLPEMQGAAFMGHVLPHTATGTVRAQCLVHVPPDLAADNGMIMRVWTTGTAATWDLLYTGGLTLRAFNSAGTQLFTQGVGFTIQGQTLAAVIEMVQNGANVDWRMLTRDNGSGAALEFTGTLASQTIGQSVAIQINADGAMTTEVIGHVLVTAAIPGSDIQDALRGYSGETAGRRLQRLCSEESIPFTGFGDLDDSVAMGTQTPAQMLDLFAECEASDLGQLFESRDQLGLAYRTRSSRAAQNPAVALAYTALRELTPVEDDQGTRNDITVTRIGGSSARATVDTGPLSTQAPPNGVGRYDDVIELSLAADSQLAGQANLRVTLGTIDEPRYPVLSVQLAGTAFAASQALISSALDIEHGDLITVTGTPVWVPPGTIEAHTIGQVETLGVREYQIDYVCQPARPIGATGLYDSTAARWAADGSTLNATMTTSATSVTVTTPADKPLWTTTDVPLDIVVAGEQITVGAISGASSPQTFSSLTRSVNGVVKAHLAGEAVQLADPDYYAL